MRMTCLFAGNGFICKPLCFVFFWHVAVTMGGAVERARRGPRQMRMVGCGVGDLIRRRRVWLFSL